MKKITFLLVLAAILAFSLTECRSPRGDRPGGTPDSLSLAARWDTLEKIRLDSLFKVANSYLAQNVRPAKVGFAKYNVADSLEYWIDGEKGAAVVSAAFHKPDFLLWPTYFVWDSQMFMVRYRELDQIAPDTSALEVLIYLRGDSVAYCEERGTVLKNGTPAAYLRRTPHVRSTRSLSDIHGLYLPHWKEVRDTLSAAGINVPVR